MRDGPNRDYYLKKRGQGHTHTQAVIALARRRVDVLWALLRDKRCYAINPPTLSEAAVSMRVMFLIRGGVLDAFA